MRMASFKDSAAEDFSELQEFIQREAITGADITTIIDDIYGHYEVANRLNFINSKGVYRDLLSRLVKTYGH
tara:strand:+ start:3843 stop:4055 length:213 start_codon:yes stop_codon:yes gene_type:complete